jgi:hypothetical protein
MIIIVQHINKTIRDFIRLNKDESRCERYKVQVIILLFLYFRMNMINSLPLFTQTKSPAHISVP